MKQLTLISSILGTVIGSLPIDPADQQKLRNELDELNKCNATDRKKSATKSAKSVAKPTVTNA
jgi:hypothetical protein